MLRRTLLLFVGFVLLVLVVTVGYALLGLSGPRTAIADADRALAQDRLGEAVRLLDIAERTLTAGDQDELRPAILQRRYRAHHALGNVPAARRDIEAFLELTKATTPEPEVEVEHAEILLADAHPEAALELARSLIETSDGPVRARALEISGEAHQAIYQRRTKTLVDTFDQVLGESSRQAALDLLKSVLYRRGDDAVARRALRELFDLLRHGSATAVSLQGWQTAIAEIRGGVQQALTFFRKSLECPDGRPVAAFRGVEYALQQSGRADCRRAVQDLYLRRYSHAQTVYAAIAAAEERLAAGDRAGAVAVADRYLPPGTALDRAKAGKFPAATKRLLVTLARALLELHDQERLDVLMRDVQAVHDKVMSMTPEYFVILGCVVWNNDDAGQWWREAVKATATQEAPKTAGYDLYQIGVDLQERWLSERGRTRELEQALDAWCQARPNDVRPHRRRCEQLLASGRPDLAIADATFLVQHRTRDEDGLALYVRAVDEAAKATNRDAAQLLARLIARGSDHPAEPHDPAIYLAMGDLALKKGLYSLAANCGRLATPAFPWAEWPRRMEAQARALAGDPLEARRAAQAYREACPGSEAALRLYVQSRTEAERGEPGLLFDAALHAIASPSMAEAMLTAAIKREQRALLPGLCQRVMYRYGGEARVVLRAAMGMLAADRTERARELLLQVPVAFPDDHAACVEAATRFLLIEAKATPSSPLLGLAVRTLVLHARDDAKTLQAVAEELERAGQPALVLAVLAPLLEDEARSEGRNGKVFALAGRACLGLEQTTQAEVHLTAALRFEDGHEAAPSLALLWLLQKRRSDAESALWQREATDEASACLLASMDQPEAAVRWARSRVREAPLDVGASLLLALYGTADDKRTVPGDFVGIVRREGPTVLRTLTLMAMPGFEVMGENAAAALHERLPQSPVAWFLYARALARVGKRDRAVAELTELTQKTPNFLPAYDEVLRITDGGLHGDLTKIGPLISSSVITAPFLATPRMRAMVGEAFATQVGMRRNDPESALPLLARLWIQFPQESRAGLENVATLMMRGRTEDAFELLRRLESQLPDSERSKFLDFYFSLGRALVKSGETTVAAELEAKARRTIDTEQRPYGAVVHYLVDQLEATRGPFVVDGERAPHAAEAEALLVRHLEFMPSFQDANLQLCLRTLARLEQIESPDEVLVRIDDLLHRDPTLLPVWMRRAELLEARNDVDGALRSLRWIADYVPDRPTILTLARLAGEHDALAPKDAELIDTETSPELAASAEAAFPLGLVAFRRGRLDAAAELLAKAPARADGAHLFFAGMVALERDDLDGAHTAFAHMAEQHPDTDDGLWAGHLAAQLACLLD